MDNDLLKHLNKIFDKKRYGLLTCHSFMRNPEAESPNDDLYVKIVEKTIDSNFFCAVVRITDHEHTVHLGNLSFTNTVNLHKFSYILDDGLYLICFTPVINISSFPEIETSDLFLQSKLGSLRLAFGNGFAKETVFKCILDLFTGEKTDYSHEFLIHKKTEGPHLNSETFSRYSDFVDALEKSGEDVASNVYRAFQLVNEASTVKEMNYKYLLYMIALDSLFGEEYSKKVFINKLASHYGANYNFIKGELLFDKLWGFRTGIVHRGRVPLINQEFERFIQLLIMDYVRAILNLPCLYLAKNFKDEHETRFEYFRYTVSNI